MFVCLLWLEVDVDVEGGKTELGRAGAVERVKPLESGRTIMECTGSGACLVLPASFARRRG